MVEDDRRVSPEFWRDEEAEHRVNMRRQFFRWTLLFSIVLAFFAFTLWWAASVVRFSSARIQFRSTTAWRVWGTVRDARTGAAVPWAHIRDDPRGRPPLFETTAGVTGAYELVTIAEPHDIYISRLGYRQTKVQVGRRWFLWTPGGNQRVDIILEPENPRPW